MNLEGKRDVGMTSEEVKRSFEKTQAVAEGIAAFYATTSNARVMFFIEGIGGFAVDPDGTIIELQAILPMWVGGKGQITQ